MSTDNTLIFNSSSHEEDMKRAAGGKALNMWRLSQLTSTGAQVERLQVKVPAWFCISTDAFDLFVEENNLHDSLTFRGSNDPESLEAFAERAKKNCLTCPIPAQLLSHIQSRLSEAPFSTHYVAVRSSGADEDSGQHSFAGQFETYLFQRGTEQIIHAIRSCWASCFSARVMAHRLECGMNLTRPRMGVVVQVMVNSESSGVAFSRHPLKAVSTNNALVESVFGLGEGLVSGEIEPDSFEVDRKTFEIKERVVVDKEHQLTQVQQQQQQQQQDKHNKDKETTEEASSHVVKNLVPAERKKQASLTEKQVQQIAQFLVILESTLNRPQDFEYGYEAGDNTLYCLQARPIVTLPVSSFFNGSIGGNIPTLWDNSNIVESYSGVTSPATFSFASYAYTVVYTCTLSVAGVPREIVEEYQPYLSNMLGLMRGNIYYNLMNWYRCLSCIPVGVDKGKFMETMMGVKQALDPDLERELGEINATEPKYSILTKIKVLFGILHKIYYLDDLVKAFFANFNIYYEEARNTDFYSLTIQEQAAWIRKLHAKVTTRWETPILNDTYVMLFFGFLKKLVGQYLALDVNAAQSLQNDLLCGQGDVESTEPTKMLMRIAAQVDTGSASVREWFLNNPADVIARVRVLSDIRKARKTGSKHVSSSAASTAPTTSAAAATTTSSSTSAVEAEKHAVCVHIEEFLDRFGFRCINELKLEEFTLHDQPDFVIDSISGYIRTKSYSIHEMEERELAIRHKAEAVIKEKLNPVRRTFFNWILWHARRGVRHRENMRFARTKLFGVFRELWRGYGENLVKMGILQDRQDAFYLTQDELYAYADGRSVTNDIAGLVALRKAEYDGYRKGVPPPERFLTRGAVGLYMDYPQILGDLDLLRQHEADAAADPHVLRGTPCCPGIVEGVVRVAATINETKGLDGEILVTARTDPGWVPLYPLCSGLLIERGSLLSHSAVVARELGLPTIVGISGGLMKRLKTGMRVRIDAAKGEVRLLDVEGASESTEASGTESTKTSSDTTTLRKRRSSNDEEETPSPSSSSSSKPVSESKKDK